MSEGLATGLWQLSELWQVSELWQLDSTFRSLCLDDLRVFIATHFGEETPEVVAMTLPSYLALTDAAAWRSSETSQTNKQTKN